MILAREFGVWDVDAFMASISLAQLLEWCALLNEGAEGAKASTSTKRRGITDARVMESTLRSLYG